MTKLRSSFLRMILHIFVRVIARAVVHELGHIAKPEDIKALLINVAGLPTVGKRGRPRKKAENFLERKNVPTLDLGPNPVQED